MPDPGGSTGVQPSVEAIEAAGKALYAYEAGGPGTEWYKHGVPWEAIDPAHWLHEARAVLTAAYPAIHAAGVAEGRAAMLGEVVEWADGHAARQLNGGNPQAASYLQAFATGLARDFDEARFPSEETT